jgi:hypothetical protein
MGDWRKYKDRKSSVKTENKLETMFRWGQIKSFSKEEIFERFRAREHQEGVFDEESAKCICLS